MKHSIFKRLFALTLSLLMVCSLLPMTALAEEAPLTLTQALDSAEELTLPYAQEVTLSSTYIDEYGGVNCFQAYHYQNTGTEKVNLYYTAYREIDTAIYLYQKDADNEYQEVAKFDNDSMDYNGEDGVIAVASGEEYWILVAPWAIGTDITIDITFTATEDTSDQLIADATAIPSLPYTTDITETATYVVDGKMVYGSAFSLAMTEDQTIFLRTEGGNSDDCTTMVFAASETDKITYLTELDTGYIGVAPTGAVFKAPADGTYYFAACNSDALTAVAFTGQYHPVTEETEPTATAVDKLPFTATDRIGGAAGEYWEADFGETYYGMAQVSYSLQLTAGQTILPTALWNGKSYLDGYIEVIIPNFGTIELDSSMTFAAPDDGEYIFTFGFYDYPWDPAEVTVSLRDVSDLPTETDLIKDATPLTLGETATKEGVEALIGGFFGMPGRIYTVAAAFSMEVEADKEYYLKGSLFSETYVFMETDDGRYRGEGSFEGSVVHAATADTTIYIVNMAKNAGDLSMTATEAVDNSLSFADPDDLPVPGEDDLWSWDNDTLTLSLKDGCNIFGTDHALYLPDGATIIVEGEVSLDNLKSECIYAEGDLTIRGKEVDADGNPTATLNITSGVDGIDCYNLIVEDLNLNIEAGWDGLYIEENAAIDNCVLTIASGGDGIDCGNLIMEDLNLNIEAGSDGLYIYETATIDNCVLTIASDDEGIDCDNISDEDANPIATCSITDSVIDIHSPYEEAIDVDILTLTNCYTTLVAGDGEDADDTYEAIDAEVSVTVNGGSLNAVSYVDNAISAPVLTISDDTDLTLVTYSDGHRVISCKEKTLPKNAIMTYTAVITAQYGDLNGTNGVTAEDALLALQIATSKVNATPVQTIVGDVDNTDDVSANDALLILQYATQKIDQFPAEVNPEPDTETDSDPDQGIGSGDSAEDNMA